MGAAQGVIELHKVQQKGYSMQRATVCKIISLAVIAFFFSYDTFAQRPDIAKVRQEVRDNNYAFEVGENPATKYPLEQLCGTRMPAVRRPRLKAAPQETGPLPESLDWRLMGGVTPIKNQGGCGACWAFAAMGVAESAYLIRTGQVMDFSEQWLISCTEAGNCNGGWYEQAFDAMMSTQDECSLVGAPLEEVYPYEMQNSGCSCTPEDRYPITNWSSIDYDMDQMKQAIMTYGPIAVSVCANDLFQCYVGGIFNADTNKAINHTVVLVGWDDNQGAAGVWYLRNSWGPGWGEGGYMRIEYGKNSVGLAPAWAEVTPEDDPNDFDVPGSYATIAEALAAAGDGGTITLAPGIYTGAGNTDIDFMGKAVTIRSTNPGDPDTIAKTVIDCAGAPGTPVRGFSFISGEGSNSMLNGLTIRNGYQTGNGGGIYCYYSSPTIRNCVFENNIATGYKKAGGAIALYNSSPAISKCRFVGNTASAYGGAISCRDSSSPAISECEILDNIAGNEGGGIYCWVNSLVAMDHLVIAGNQANDAGGGIFMYECTAGADANEPIIEHCTIANNTTDGLGGGIFLFDSVAKLHNSILWNNTCGELEGDEIALLDDSLQGTRIEVSYCDVTGLDQGHWIDPFCTLDWGSGNIGADPLFANAAGRDYHLKSASGHWDITLRNWVLDDGDNFDPSDDENSPAIDAGDPISEFDQEYQCNGNAVNLGVYGNTTQASRSPNVRCCMQCLQGDFNCDCIINMEDLVVLMEQWLECNVLPRHYCAQ